MKLWAPVFALPTRIQNELIRSSSEKLPIWKAVIKKIFVFYLCLKENRTESLIAAVFDCLFGPGAGLIFENHYEYLVTFGPSVFSPTMVLITILLGLNGFIYGGFLNKIIQLLILVWSTFFTLNGKRLSLQFKYEYGAAAMFNPPTGVNSLVLCQRKTCIGCFCEFPKVFITSEIICGCVCQSGNSERCYRTAKDCGKCNSRFTVQFLEANRAIQVIQILPLLLLIIQCRDILQWRQLSALQEMPLNSANYGFGLDLILHLDLILLDSIGIKIEDLNFFFQCLSYSTAAFITICVVIREGFRLLQRVHKILKPEFPWLFSYHDSCANAKSVPKETENTNESEPSVFELMMLKTLTELAEAIEQQKVEMTNQQKTFNQKQDQIEGKIKEILNEQRNMNKQEKVLSQQQKATLNNLEKMEGNLENYHEELTVKQQEVKKLCLDTRSTLNNQVKQQGLLQNLVLDLQPPNKKDKNQNVAQSDPESVTECKICMERPLDAVLKNCGHTMCFECAQKMKREKKDCPTCREKIMGFQKIFL